MRPAWKEPCSTSSRRSDARLGTRPRSSSIARPRSTRGCSRWATLLYLVAQTVRPRGWHTILRAAFPEATDLRPRDVIRAYLAGAGINALVPARGGDVVKLALRAPAHRGRALLDARGHLHPRDAVRDGLRHRARGVGAGQGFIPVPTTSGELPALDVSLVLGHPIVSVLVAGGARPSSAARLVRRAARRPAPGAGDPLLAAALRLRRRELAGARRASSAWARWRPSWPPSALPVTPATVVLVMAAQGGGRILPLAPASAGLRLAMLSYGFVEVTGRPVDIAAITAFTFGVGAVLLVAGWRSRR